MKAYKERQFLVFEFEDGKNVKYNLANGECIGKSGRVVKDIKSQLRNLSLLDVIESFEDENYKRFLRFVDSRVNASTSSYYYGRRVDKITNIGSFLLKVKDYSEYEQFFSSQIKRVDYRIHFKFKDVPKGLLKLCRERNLELNDRLYESYKENVDMFNLIPNLDDFRNISKSELFDLYTYDYISYRYGSPSCKFSERGKYRFHILVKNYNYKPLSLLKYIDDMMTYEAFNSVRGVMDNLFDYVKMMAELSDKYDKYPRNLLTSHQIATRNYNRFNVKFDEEKFQSVMDERYEFEYEDYAIIYPNSADEIKEEGIKMNHCVASYIGYVLEGRCHILFLRKKDELDKSLVTIEVKNDKVVQAKRKFNADISTEEREVIKKYNKYLSRKVCVAEC